MRVASLRYPDLPSLRRERLYSATVAAGLRDAYACIAMPNRTTHSYIFAYERIASLQGVSMSPEQRLRMDYLLALIFGAVGDTRRSLRHVDDAIERATMLKEHSAIPELLFLRSAMHRQLSDLTECAYDLRLALASLRDLEAASSWTDPDLEATMLTSLAGMEFILGRFDTCDDLLTQTAALFVGESKPGALAAATVAWIRALLFRWRGQPDRALPQALAAADVYDREETYISAGRLHGIVADITLDLAKRFTESGRDSFLTLAQQHIAVALDTAQLAQDKTGEALALLADARFARLSERDMDRKGAIEAVMRFADQNADASLLGQAYTALGSEFDSTGEQESALHCYRRAVSVLTNAEAIALALWPQRALLVMAERDGGAW